MVHIGQLAPIWETIVVTTNPLNCLLLQETIILSGSLLDSTEVYYSLMPSLSENCNCQISFGAELRLMSFYLGAVREAFESHRAIIAQGNGISGKKFLLFSFSSSMQPRFQSRKTPSLV